LPQGNEEGGLLVFVEVEVFSVCGEADDLKAGAVVEFEVAADGVGSGSGDSAEDPAGKLLIDDGDARGVPVVVGGEGAAGEKGGAGGGEVIL
jgi:hypothetical protein